MTERGKYPIGGASAPINFAFKLQLSLFTKRTRAIIHPKTGRTTPPISKVTIIRRSLPLIKGTECSNLGVWLDCVEFPYVIEILLSCKFYYKN